MANFLQLFVIANILLGFTYLAFVAVTRTLERLGLFVPHQHLVRGAQALVLLSVLGPGAMSFLPGKELPAFGLPSFHAVPESLTLPAITLKRSVKQTPRATATPEQIANTVNQFRDTKADLAQIAFAAWILGLLVLSVRLANHFRKLRRLLHRSISVRKQGRVRVAVSNALSVPISAFHRGKFWVVLPEPMLLQRQDWNLALKHELQHHRQGDTRWALLVEWIVCFFYPNPAVYLWKRRIVELQEFSCDEALVGQLRISSRDYGSCLVRVAETALGCRDVYVGTTYMALAAKNPIYFKSFLTRRIEMFMNQKRPRARKWVSVVTGTLGLVATLSVAYGIERSARAVKEALPNAGHLVVDEKIQRIAQKILADAIHKQEASDGYAIVADPQTGRILAVANVDARNNRTGYWALAEQMEPASIAKTIVVAEALEQGKTTPSESHNCENGKYNYGGKIFHDWKKGGFGHLTTTEAVAVSSGICVAKIAEKIGAKGVYDMLERFGFGPEGSAKSFPASRAGFVPGRGGAEEKFLVPYVAFGQGFRATPLELVQAYGAIANGGNLLAPLPGDAPDSARRVVRRVLSPENAEKVRGILKEVVLSGTGRQNAGSYLYTTAGKTASGYGPDEEGRRAARANRNANMAGFIGFAPVNQPRVEVLVSIRNPQVSKDAGSGAHGAEHAAPVFRQITEAVLQQMKVEPDLLREM